MPDPGNALIEYIDGARRRLAEFEGPGESTWRSLIDQAMGDAYSRGDRSGLARVVQLLSHLLEGQGRFEDALREVDVALPVAAGEPGATASLLALKAALTAGRGDAVAAGALAQQAAAIADGLADERERLKTVGLCATVSLQTFQATPESFDGLLSRLVASGRWQDQLFVLSWLVPALAALGRPAEAAPHVRVMAAVARAKNAHFRSADAAAFHDWGASVVAPHVTPLRLRREFQANALADWRVRCLELWRLIMRRDWKAAPAALRGVELAQRRVGGNVGDATAWSRIVSAAMGEGTRGAIPPPPGQAPTLGTIGTTIASAYAAAQGGSAAEARPWLDWVTRTRRTGVESSMESPVSLRRVQGLLALRAGQPTAARRHLDEAVPWCAAAGMQLEHKIARIQSLELQQKMFANAVPGLQLDGELSEASASLSAIGVDPVPHRYAIASAWDAGSNRARSTVLTSRESDVLHRLGEGLSYVEAAKALGVAPATVQTVAHRVYDKLGVHRRLDALREAKRLALL